MIDKLTEHYQENFDKLAKQAGRKLSDAAYGQDCVQESYMIALKYLDTYKPDRGTFEQWFGRIYARAVSRYRAFIRDKGVTKEFNPKDVEIPFEDILQKYPRLLNDSLDLLTNPEHRNIVHMHLRGYSAKEIRQLSGQTLPTIFQVVKRFKERVMRNVT